MNKPLIQKLHGWVEELPRDLERSTDKNPASDDPNIPRVYSLAPRHGWWTDSPNVGQNLAPSQYCPSAGPVTGLVLQPPVIGEPQTSPLQLGDDGPPEVHSVALGMTYPSSTARQNLSPTIYARIQAGVGAGRQEFEIDWQNGTTFTLPFNSLKVIPVWEAEPDVVTGLVVTVCKGSVGRPFGAQRTFARALTAAAGASSVLLRLPPFTKGVYLYPANQASAPLVYAATTFLNFAESSLGVPIMSVPGNVIGSGGAGAVRVPNSAQYCFVSNTAGSGINFNLVADLGF